MEQLVSQREGERERERERERMEELVLIHYTLLWSIFSFLIFFLSSGGLTGAGARITGAFGDIFAKLSFDDDFIDQRQQQKVKSSKLSSKVGGFFKVRYGRGVSSYLIILLQNVAEGVTGVVAQPIKGERSLIRVLCIVCCRCKGRRSHGFL